MILTDVILLFPFPSDFIISMRDIMLTVDEGVEDNMEIICVRLTVDSGEIVECDLEVTLLPSPGTAGMYEC